MTAPLPQPGYILLRDEEAVSVPIEEKHLPGMLNKYASCALPSMTF